MMTPSAVDFMKSSCSDIPDVFLFLLVCVFGGK